MTKIKKIVATFVFFLLVFSFICAGTSFKPVASSSANSEIQAAASPFHPIGLQPTQTPSQPATSRPLFHPTNNEAAICGVGNHWDDSTGTCVPDNQPTQPDSQSCLQSGGRVETQMCCKSASDFRNTCTRAIGACGCSPDNSKETALCDCGEGKCFDGTSCVPLPCGSEGDSCTSDSQCCSGLTCQSGKCTQKPNGECNAGVLIQGQIVSIRNPCRDFQSGSACSFDVRIVEVLKGNYPNIVTGQTIVVSYTSGSQKFDAQVGDCIEVCATWDTNLYCGDDIGYIKKIDCSPGPNPCNPGPTGSYQCINNMVQEEYQKEDCSREWRTIDDCNSYNPSRSCKDGSCVEKAKRSMQLKFQGKIIGTPITDPRITDVATYNVKVESIPNNVDIHVGDVVLVSLFNLCSLDPGQTTGRAIPKSWSKKPDEWNPAIGDKVEVYGNAFIVIRISFYNSYFLI